MYNSKILFLEVFMKKLISILICLLTVFIFSCASSDDEGDGVSCASSFDCPVGKVCAAGRCVYEDSADGGSNGNGNGSGSEIPDGGNGSGDSTDTASDNDGNGSSSGNSNDSDPNGDSEENNDNDSGSGSNSGVYDTELSPDEDVEFCEDSCIPLEPECLPAMDSEAASGLCNGLDDDCDGRIDEGCPCKAGETQSCFAGPRNFRNIGSCQDGVQTCIVQMRAGQGDWGQSQCVGGIKPSADICDNADNNCNGCKDDRLCCTPPIDCAYKLDVDAAGNPDPFLPFKYKIIDGKQIYRKFDDADTATWEWTLSQGPCDIVLNKVNSFVKGGKTLEEVGDVNTDNGTASTVVSGVGMSQFKVKFRLSGSYNLHLKVTRENGEVYECEWVIRVVSDGLRIELCWDTTGPTDVDLHLGKTGQTTGWDTSGAKGDCYYSNMGPDWGYAKTANYDKNGNWNTSMNNPRLDMDNITTVGEPENINVDNPVEGDTFRVMVRHYDFDASNTHPVINVYCGGTLKATYGVDPQVANFNSRNDSWKVVEIKWKGSPDSDTCELTPKWNDATGYVVIDGALPTSYDDW